MLGIQNNSFECEWRRSARIFFCSPRPKLRICELDLWLVLLGFIDDFFLRWLSEESGMWNICWLLAARYPLTLAKQGIY